VAYDANFAAMLPSYRNRNVGNVTTLNVIDGVPPLTTLFARVRAYDAAENESTSSDTIRITTLALPDLDPPSAVIAVEADAVESDRFLARWLAATDNVGVTGYLVDVSQDIDFATFVEGWESRDV